MKKQRLLSGVFIVVIGTFAYCTTPEQKVADKKESVVDASNELEKAQSDYLEEIAAFRKDNADKFAANEKIIADFRARIASQKREAKAEYNKKISELEGKNSDFRKRLDLYNESNKEQWEAFKKDFKSDMDQLNNAINDFSINNK
jgi:predicted TIM-barrel fold metal-dependent hydrolase